MPDTPAQPPRLRFDRHELAGSFGDIGTDLPLLIGIIAAAQLDAASVFIVFGLLQMMTGVIYGLPMPMQPLKAMAVLVISQKIAGATLYGAGLAIGAIILLLSLSGALTWLARVIPRCVVRGVQVGLGLSLATLALGRYVPAQGAAGWWLAGGGFLIMLLLWGNRRAPAGLVLIVLGAAYALIWRVDGGAILGGIGLRLPQVHWPQWDSILTGAVVLALPQLPLSLSNSLIATRQTVADLFPQRAVSIRKLGVTYGVVNLMAPLLGGIPVCHGCGGLAGHYAFGARTGGSVVIYGAMYVVLGVLFGGAAGQVVEVFPLPILGVVLLFEALVLMRLVGDTAGSGRELTIALVVAVTALCVPQGFVVGLVVGTGMYYFSGRLPALREGG
ncbi:MAG: putative sulfate/molybdate transporter [Phycisphaerales bacterium]|nr:putative sulfate/molybdate transporter [Phycisphaerales bacterium]